MELISRLITYRSDNRRQNLTVAKGLPVKTLEPSVKSKHFKKIVRHSAKQKYQHLLLCGRTHKYSVPIKRILTWSTYL